MLESMFHMHVPLAEKLLRPVIIYLVLIVFLRLFGKRELAQLNPFDLVVLLSLSNTVQNAIIGNDNSISGGIVGAFSLLAINWLLTRVTFHLPRLNSALEGTSTTLILDGRVDHEALRREALTSDELLSVLHKQSFDSFEDVRRCALEPNGTFFIEAKKPSEDENTLSDLTQAVKVLTEEVERLRAGLNRMNAV